MKVRRWLMMVGACILAINSWSTEKIAHGFSFNQDVPEVTLRYKKFNNLIVLSTTLNKTLPVNLILDSGFRNVVLFGKKYAKHLMPFLPQTISFSGLGDEQPCTAKLSLGNQFALQGITGTQIPVVVTTKRSILSEESWIDGIIGYDILYKFEIEVDPRKSTITFRPTRHQKMRDDMHYIPLLPDAFLPTITGSFEWEEAHTTLPVLIDTGSQLGMLLKSAKHPRDTGEPLARGICGVIRGRHDYTRWFRLGDNLVFKDVSCVVTGSQETDTLSIGMGFLKDHIFILNLTLGYFAIHQKQQGRSPLKLNKPTSPFAMRN